MKKAKIKSIDDRAEEYLPGPKPVCVQARTGREEVIEYSPTRRLF